VISCLLAVDLLASRRPWGLSRAMLLSAAWVGAGIGFGLVVIATLGGDAGQQYFAAYLVEKTLSVDNLFVFALLFQAFAVPATCQHRVLLAGVAGALALRGGFIVAGACAAGSPELGVLRFRRFPADRRGADGPRRREPRSAPRPGAARPAQGRAGQRGLRWDALCHPQKREARRDPPACRPDRDPDLVFAVDWIPAVFGVTTSVFIVLASNAFAVLGLRALYLVLAGGLQRFTCLRQGMAVLLAFIGAKMILAPVLHIPTAVSLAAIVVIIAGAVGLSRLGNSRMTPAAPGGTPDAPQARADVRRLHA
jgi:tellurite resistance protein TerC